MDMRTLRGAASVGFMRSLWAKVRHDDVLNGAAALAFYMTLAIFPAMIVVMAVIPYLPIEQVDQALMQLLRQALPGHAADLFSDVVQEITTEQRGGLLSAGLAGSLWITSTGMYAVMRQLNRTYGVRESRGFLRGRLTALGLSLLFGVLVIGGFSLIVLGDRLQGWLVVRLGGAWAMGWLFLAFRWVVILAGLLLAFALVEHLAPNRRQRFQLLTAGSITGVALLVCASVGFAWYTKYFGSYGATYGSIGAVILLMLWLFAAGLAILLSAEVNQQLRQRASGNS
ncbi:YihY/virulence factor BrkB family protein [Aquincola tertiaricarbonis]|uniref:YihY/virulence factor BrkB family protein n=1 Tax=Aquincola tertiaricarbonis TaxID=391953 RepID=UPI000615365B|nr:YihY/virulence factor BrkB family protein [Aquincola tertiaricarbonis]